MATTVVQFRIEESLKNEAVELFDKLGLDLPTAFRMFLKKAISSRGIPFNIVLGKKDEEKLPSLMKKISQDAEKNGISDMTLDEINEEISEYRKEKQRA